MDLAQKAADNHNIFYRKALCSNYKLQHQQNTRALDLFSSLQEDTCFEVKVDWMFFCVKSLQFLAC